MKSSPHFEASFARLEEIVQSLNTGKVSLQDSLTLYEEADHLILTCMKKLQEAEQKIETLIKNREGELSLDENKLPLKETFATNES